MAFEALALPTVAPTVARELRGVGLYAWIFSAFLLAQMVGGVAAGQQADRRGFAGPFLAALAVLGVGLLVGGLASNMVVLILGRALQGLGGGALVACVYAIINAAYPDGLRPRMMTAFSSAFVLPALVGPAVAGFVAEQISWRAVFLGFPPFLVAVGFLTLPAFNRLTPAGDRVSEAGAQASRLPGAIALAAGTGLLLAGLKLAADDGPSPTGLPPALVGLLLAAVGLSVAVAALRNVLPRGTLTARKGLPATIAARGLMAAGYFYTEAYLVLALNEASGYSATTAGLVISAGALSWAAGTWTQERLDRRSEGRGRRARVLLGTALMAAGITGLAAVFVAGGGLTLAVAVAGWIAASLGIGLANPASTTIAFARTPEGKEGAVGSSVLIAELLGPAATIGVGGAIVALGTASSGLTFGVALAFGLVPVLAILALLSAYRLPRDGPAQNYRP